MPKREYHKIVRELDESLMKPLPNKRGWSGDVARAEQMYDNMWAHFGMTREARKVQRERLKAEGLPLPCVSDWAWTQEVQDEFYAHPFHKAFVNKARKMDGMAWGMWVLNSEPATYKEAV